jgi:DNA recombination protein RmuC
MDLTQIAALALTALLALALGYLLGTLRGKSGGSDVAAASHKSELAGRDARLADAERQRRELQEEMAKLRSQLDERGSALAAAQASVEAERQQGAEKLAMLQGAREELSNQFKALAAEILDDKGKKFVELNHSSITTLLTPLQTELNGFRQKVEEVYVNEGQQRSALAEQVRALSELNGTLRDETTNLTRALKGDSKAQGDWGEMLLDQLLSNAGLIEGQQYTRQATQLNADGDRVIPDVVLHLPQGRDMVVDSKVTLTAYSEYAAEHDPERRELLLQAHLTAVKSHIKGLSEKRYEELYKLSSLDFVVMFMPLEGAFMAAVTGQKDLFQLAWNKNVLIVSPSTFLFVVRTIAHVWRQEAQSRNAQDIADRGAKMLDKFVAFSEDLLKVGEHLEKAQKSFGEARNKLTDGKGSLVRQSKMLQELGVKASKKLDKDLLTAAGEEETE